MRCESLHFSLPSSAKQQREIVPQTTQNLGHTYSDIFPDTATVRTHPPNFAANPEISIPLTDVVKSCPVSYLTINQYGGTTCGPCFSRVNPDTIRCVWTGEFDLNSLRMDGEYFRSIVGVLRVLWSPFRGLGILRSTQEYFRSTFGLWNSTLEYLRSSLGCSQRITIKSFTSAGFNEDTSGTSST